MLIMILVMMTWIRQSEGAMTLTELVDQTGFIDLQMRDQDIVMDSDIVLHIVDIKQI